MFIQKFIPFFWLLPIPLVLFGQTRMGYVNTQMVMEKVDEARTIVEKMDALRREYEAQYSKLNATLKDLEEKFERQKLVLTKSKIKILLNEINKKKGEITQFKRSKLLSPSGELYQKTQQLRTPLIDKILKAIEVIAKKNEIDLILDNSDTIVLFANNNIDFTQDVINYLNQDVN